MTDVSFVDLVVRMLVSLAVVLGLMFGAFWILRRRQGFAPISSSRPPRRSPRRGSPRSGSSGSGGLAGLGGFAGLGGLGGAGGLKGRGGGSQRVAGNRRGLRVLGRVGVGRTTQVVAVQFAERVFLLAASDQAAPAVLAELDLAEWLASTEATDATIDALITGPVVCEAIDPTTSRPVGLLESLREATTRRG